MDIRPLTDSFRAQAVGGIPSEGAEERILSGEDPQPTRGRLLDRVAQVQTALHTVGNYTQAIMNDI